MSKIPLPIPLIPLMVYLIPIAVGLAVALWFFKKKLAGDVLISSGAPICLWLALVLMFDLDKSLVNFIYEPLILAAAILVWEVIRLALDGRGVIKGQILQGVNIAGSLLFTLCVLFFVPYLEE